MTMTKISLAHEALVSWESLVDRHRFDIEEMPVRELVLRVIPTVKAKGRNHDAAAKRPEILKLL